MGGFWSRGALWGGSGHRLRHAGVCFRRSGWNAAPRWVTAAIGLRRRRSMSRETGRPPSSYLRTQLPHIVRVALDDGFEERGSAGPRGRHGSAQDFAEAVERTFVAL